MEYLPALTASGLIPADTPITGWRDARTGLWHGELPCATVPARLRRGGAAVTTFGALVDLAPGSRCPCADLLINYADHATDDELNCLVYLAGADPAGCADTTATATVANLRQAAVDLATRPVPATLTAAVAAQLEAVDTAVTAQLSEPGFVADAGYQLVQRLPYHDPLGPNVPPARYGMHPGTPAQRLADLPVGHRGRLLTALGQLHDLLPHRLYREIRIHADTSPDAPGPHRDTTAALMWALSADLMWFDHYPKTTTAPDLFAWAADFDPADPELVLLPAAAWWTSHGPNLTPIVADASQSRADVTAARRLADRRTWRVEETLAALHATRC